MSTIKVIAHRPDPTLYLPESVTSSSVQRPITIPIVGKYIMFPLKFIYSPKIINGIPQPPLLLLHHWNHT